MPRTGRLALAILTTVSLLASFSATPGHAKNTKRDRPWMREVAVHGRTELVKDPDFVVKFDWAPVVLFLSLPADEGSFLSTLKFFDYSTQNFSYYSHREMEPQPFVPTGVLSQKAKIFNDGLYAAAELAAQNGFGKYAGKQALLTSLARGLENANAPVNDGVCQIFAAAKIGIPDFSIPAAHAQCASQIVEVAMRTEKPISFYTWSPELAKIWVQDKILQRPLEAENGLDDVIAALQSDEAARKNILSYIDFLAALTNPKSTDIGDIRDLLREEQRSNHAVNLKNKNPNKINSNDQEKYYQLFPLSRNHEQEYMNQKNYVNGSGITISQLLELVQSGDIELKPKSDSGWYDQKIFAFEPFVFPEHTAEARKRVIDEQYRKHLEDLFIGNVALTKETHTKGFGAAGGGIVVEKFYVKLKIYPGLSVEPNPTYYLRQAEAYRFIGTALRKFFGHAAVTSMKRQTMGGPVDNGLSEEIDKMRSLFIGAARTIAWELGMPIEEFAKKEKLSIGSKADEAVYKAWVKNINNDSDLAEDLRAMVPLYYNAVSGDYVVALFLGWRERSLAMSFKEKPNWSVLRKDENIELDIEFESESKRIVTPVVKEVRTQEILNREEFRRLCDQYRTPEEIVAALTASQSIPLGTGISTIASVKAASATANETLDGDQPASDAKHANEDDISACGG